MHGGTCRRALLLTALLLLFSRAGSAATLTLAWDPPADGITSGYFVLYGTQSGAYTHTIDAGMVTTYTVDNLADGVTYYFAVQAYDSSRRVGPLSTEASGSTGATTTPPRNLSAQVNALAVALTWEAGGSGVLGYRIEIGRGPSQSNVGTIATDAATTFTVNGLVSGTYYIRVRSDFGPRARRIS